MENQDKFKMAFGIMVERYRNILSNIYPAYGKTGFTERNLSHNYAAALETVFGEKTISWFEMPTGTGKKEHLDTITINKDKKIFILTEAKRFSNPKRKVPSILRDLERISKESCFSEIEKNCLDKINYNRYVVLLCDVWNESKSKLTILKKWEDGFIKNEVEKVDSLKYSYYNKVIYELNLMHRFEELMNPNHGIQNYSVLAYVAKVEFKN